MKRAAIILSVLLALGGGVWLPNAHAQALSGSCTAEGGVQGHYEGNTCVAGAVGADPSVTGSGNSTGTKTPVLNPPDSGDTGKQIGGVMTWIMTLLAWLLGIAAWLLDAAVNYTIVKMGVYVNSLDALDVTWRVLRDFGNMALLFGFIAIGFTIILDVDWYGGGFKMLPMLLIAAVTLNFSLFVSEAIIDSGNLFATQFYQQINGGKPAGQKELLSANTDGIANKLMAQLGFPDLYNVKNNFNEQNNIYVSFLGIMLFLITTFVLFTLAFILIARFVTLIFLIISSPIGFAGLAVPKLDGVAHKWWSALISETLVAPVLMLLLYVALSVITDVGFLKGFDGGGWLTISQGNFDQFAGTILSFLVAMGLLLVVVVVAKSMGAAGADWAMKTAGKLSFGTAGWVGRNTVGRGAYRTANWLESKRFSRIPLVGSGTLRSLDRMAKGSYDFRETGALKQLPYGGVNAGESGGKGGFAKSEKDWIKKEEDYAKRLKNTDEEEKQIKEAQTKKKSAEEGLKHTEDQKDEWLGALKEMQKKELEVVVEEVAKAREAQEKAQEKANKDGTFATPDDLKAYEDAKQQYEEATKKEQDMREEHAKAIREVEADHKRTRSLLESEKLQGTLDEKRLKAAPAIEYAERLSGDVYSTDPKTGERTLKNEQYQRTVLGQVENASRRVFPSYRTAAKNIKKTAEKSDDDKMKDKIADLLKKESGDAGKKDSSGGAEKKA